MNNAINVSPLYVFARNILKSVKMKKIKKKKGTKQRALGALTKGACAPLPRDRHLLVPNVLFPWFDA